jgi:hypothetical protein
MSSKSHIKKYSIFYNNVGFGQGVPVETFNTVNVMAVQEFYTIGISSSIFIYSLKSQVFKIWLQ